MKIKVALISLLLLLSVFQVKAQKYWSLEECIEHAINNNIQIKQIALNIEQSNLDLASSYWDLAPNLNANASHGYTWGRGLDVVTNEYANKQVQSNNFSAQSSITLFNGFKKLNTIRMNQLNKKSNELDFEKYLNDVSINIATFYLQTLFYIDNLENAKSQYEVTKQQVERTNKLVEAGKLAKGDLLSLESRAASEKLNVIEAENALSLSYLNLAQLLDIQDIANFRITEPDLEISNRILDEGTTEMVYNYAVDYLPEIKSARIKVQSANRALDIARGGLLPSLSTNYSIGTRFSDANVNLITNESIPFMDQIKDNFNQSLSLNLSIPVFNGLYQRTNISRQRLNVENTRLNLELEKQNLYKSIQQAYLDAVSALNKYDASKIKLEATKLAFEYATKRYEIKDMTYVEFIEAKKEFDNANRDLISSKYDFIFKKTILDFYRGKPISLNTRN
jgi:outer membrane protein